MTNLRVAHRRSPASSRTLLRALSATLLIAALCGLTPLPAGAAGGPVIGGVEPVTYTEGGPPVQLAPGITITGGGTFADGYVEFSIAGATAEDRLFLPEGTTPDPASGAITVIGGAVYLGLGGDYKQIGTVGDPEDGRDGRPLRINFSAALPNANFADGVDANGHPLGWTINEQHITLGSLATKTQGRAVTTTGTGPYTVSGPGYSFQSDWKYTPGSAGWAYEGREKGMSSAGSFDSAVVAHDGAAQALRLWFTTNCPGPNNPAYCSVFGPDAWSSPFEAKAGDDLAFDWAAANGGDDYEVYGFLVNTTTNEHTELMYGRGRVRGWTTSTGNIPADGTYRFRFVSGSYDATGGFYTGASLYIDNVRVLSSDATSAVAQSVARLVYYENTGDNPPGEVVIGVTAGTPDGDADPVVVPTEVTLVDDAPTIAPIAEVTYTNTYGPTAFPVRTGTVVGSDPESDPISYSIQDGVAQAATVDGQSYTHALVGALGTLHLNATTGAYAFVPNGEALDAVMSPTTEDFTVVATANGLTGSRTLTVAVGVQSSTPGAPVDLQALAGDGEVDLSWSAPAWTGGSPIESYRIEMSTDGGVTWAVVVPATADAGTTARIDGLANRTTVVFRVAATNGVGTGPVSDPISASPRTVPGAPTIGSIVPGNRTLTVHFTPPADDGGAPVTTYEYSTDGGVTWTARRVPSTDSPLVIGPLVNGTTHPVRIRAVNEAGAGSSSNEVAAAAVAAPVLPADPSTPPAPTGTGVQLVDGEERDITMTAPSPLTGDYGTPAGTLRFTDGDFRVELLGVDEQGRPLALDAEGRLVIVAGSYAQVSGEGFLPGSIVDVWLMSTPIHLGDVVVLADGTFAAKLPIPEDVAPGPHTVQMNGVAADGTVRTLSVGVIVRPAQATTGGSGGAQPANRSATQPTASQPANLAFTGGHAALVTTVGLCLLLLGSFVGASSRRRRFQR